MRASGSPPGKSARIVARRGREYHLLSLDEVYAFQADREIVWIFTADKKYAATQTVKALEERLTEANFRRVRRGVLINADKIRKLNRLSSQRWQVTLANGSSSPSASVWRLKLEELALNAPRHGGKRFVMNLFGCSGDPSLTSLCENEMLVLSPQGRSNEQPRIERSGIRGSTGRKVLERFSWTAFRDPGFRYAPPGTIHCFVLRTRRPLPHGQGSGFAVVVVG